MAVSRQHKTEAKHALVEAGLWYAFHRTRDRYKLSGMMPPEAYQAAFDDFFPNGLDSPPVLPKDCPDDQTGSGAIGDDAFHASERTKQSHGEVKTLDIIASRNDIGKVPEGALVGKSADRAEVVDWVARNVAVEKVNLAGCPSSEAWGMLRWVRMSLINEGEFWKTLYKALLPSRTEVDMAARFKDDGRNVFHAIGQMEKRMASDDSE